MLCAVSGQHRYSRKIFNGKTFAVSKIHEKLENFSPQTIWRIQYACRFLWSEVLKWYKFFFPNKYHTNTNFEGRIFRWCYKFSIFAILFSSITGFGIVYLCYILIVNFRGLNFCGPCIIHKNSEIYISQKFGQVW